MAARHEFPSVHCLACRMLHADTYEEHGQGKLDLIGTSDAAAFRSIELASMSEFRTRKFVRSPV